MDSEVLSEDELLQNEDEGDLFKDMLSDCLSTEQYAEWKRLRKQGGDQCVSSDEEDVASLSLVNSHDDAVGELPIPEPSQSETVITSPFTSSSINDSISQVQHLSLNDLDPEITTKFLRGEIGFSEFSDLMEARGQDLLSTEHHLPTFSQTADHDEGREEASASSTHVPTAADDDVVDDQDEDEETEESEEEIVDDDDDDEEWVPEVSTKQKKAKPAQKPTQKKTITMKEWSPKIKRSKLGSRRHSSLRKRKQKRKGTDLPKHLQGLMGEAHLKFARGEHDEAVKMCMEVIRLAPMAAEPFQTMGLLYEELGDLQKSLQFSLIAAHLRPQESEEWGHLAEMSAELGELKQAITCYTKALKYDPGNVTYALDRCALWEQLKEPKKVLEGFHYILKILPDAEGDKYLQIARDMAKIYHENGEVEKAIETLKEAFSKHAEVITSEDVNLLLELLMAQKLYTDSVKVLVNHCGVQFTTQNNTIWLKNEENLTEDFDTVTGCIVSDWLPIDLLVKLSVCVIQLGKFTIAKQVLSPLHEESPESSGDLYLDVAEAYMEKGRYSEARPILEKLVKTTNYALAAVWLRYAECLSVMGELDKSEHAFSKVVELAPNHTEARVALSNLQQQMGRTEEALNTLTKDMMEQTDMTSEERWLLLHKCMMLYSQKKFDEFATSSKALIISHMKDVYKPSYIRVVLSYHTLRHRNEALRILAKTNPEMISSSNTTPANDKSFSKDELWDIFVKLFDVLVDLGRQSELDELGVLALTCPLFIIDEEKAREAEEMALLAFLINKNGQYAYRFIKEICLKDMDNVNAWNVFCQAMLYTSDTRHNRFCLRCSLKDPDHLQLCILNGHNSMISGSYKHSLGEYTSALRQLPEDPLLNFCIGVTFIHMATQKFSDKRHALVTQACCFLQRYLDLRGECQESFYNIGRALHQIDLKYAAVYYYKKALTFSPAIKGDQDEFNLQREIAHNLSLIYISSNSLDYAKSILHEYCVI